MNQAAVFKILDILKAEIRSLELIYRGMHTDKNTRNYARAEAAGLEFALKTIEKAIKET